jgi:FkbM family methyltransferase
MAEQLRADVARNGLTNQLTVYHVAVSDQPGTMILQEAPGDSPHGQRYLDPSGSTIGETVEVTTVDRLLPDIAPAVVKIDIEGADLRALHGMRRMLAQRPPRLLLVEAIDSQLARFGDSSAALIEYMQEFGYEPHDVSEVDGARELSFILKASKASEPR